MKIYGSISDVGQDSWRLRFGWFGQKIVVFLICGRFGLRKMVMRLMLIDIEDLWYLVFVMDAEE